MGINALTEAIMGCAKDLFSAVVYHEKKKLYIEELRRLPIVL